MTTKFKRRQFLQASLAATASINAYGIAAFAKGTEERVEAVVIGSGFGGAVASLRLAEAGIETIVLERGRRWEITDAGDTFSTSQKPDGRSTWLSSTTIDGGEIPIDVYAGVLDIKVGNGVNVLRGAGVGGGSLVYNAITYQPTKELFYRAFPRGINYEELDRIYYPRVRSILKPSTIPDDILQNSNYLASRIFLEQAAKSNLKAIKLDMNVDWDIVRQEIAGTKVASAIDGEVSYYPTVLRHLILCGLLSHGSVNSPASASGCAIVTYSAPVSSGKISYNQVCTGQAILLLHGLFADKEQWNSMMCH